MDATTAKPPPPAASGGRAGSAGHDEYLLAKSLTAEGRYQEALACYERAFAAFLEESGGAASHLDAGSAFLLDYMRLYRWLQ